MKTVSTHYSRHISLLIVIVLLLTSLLFVPVAAKETVIANLLPSADQERGNLTLNGCTLDENSDGSVTFTLTSTSASFKMVFAEGLYSEGSGGTIFSDAPIDLSKPAFVIYDYASADDVVIGSIIGHYTRKDKAVTSILADLYLVSMEGNDYAQYSKAKGTGFGVWDWGTYVSSEPTKLFDNKIHRFCNFEGSFSGTVGSKITFYSFYVSNTSEVSGLGEVRPEKTVVTESDIASSSESSSTSEVTSEATSETSEVNSDNSSITSEVVSTTSSSASDQSENSEEAESEGIKPLVYVLIITGVLIIIIGLLVYLKVKKKK